ncbi:MAG: hypothetical protein EOO92_20500 [Pedobacter sp.]|nr:MAG: hypothetical protein EOO92_20500 [Pedobacter sp.]
MKAHFLKQLQFDYWANSQLISSMQEIQDLPERPAAVFSHIMAATHIWYSRLTDQVSPYAVWESFDQSNWQDQLQLNYDLIKAYLERNSEGNFNQIVTYKTSTGVSYNTSAIDILSHVFWHSGYHQGQIVMQLKPYVQLLPDLNYINFVRLNQV